MRQNISNETYTYASDANSWIERLNRQIEKVYKINKKLLCESSYDCKYETWAKCILQSLELQYKYSLLYLK